MLPNVCISPQEEECITVSWRDRGTMYTSDTKANLQRTLTEINKNGAIAKSKNFSRASDIVIHLRTFRVIFNGMPVLFWSYVGDLATSMGKCFFQILWPRETQIRVFFFEKIAYDLYNFSLSKLKFSWRSWFQYFNSKIFFRGMRTDLSV